MQQTANAIEHTASFHFDALVRGLCTSASVQVHCQAVRAQASVKRHNARATLDSALQSLIQHRMPLGDQTNLPARYNFSCLVHCTAQSKSTHLVVFVITGSLSAIALLLAPTLSVMHP